MSDHAIRLRLPDGFDALLRAHAGETSAVLTDTMRREFVVALLAAICEGLASPVVADALVRLNGAALLVPRGGRVH